LSPGKASHSWVILNKFFFYDHALDFKTTYAQNNSFVNIRQDRNLQGTRRFIYIILEHAEGAALFKEADRLDFISGKAGKKSLLNRKFKESQNHPTCV
jgi:hypothetical protein